LDFFVYRLASFGFDHNTKDFIWSTACRMPAVSGAEKPFCSAKSSASCSTVMPVYTLQEDRQIFAAVAEDASVGRLGILFCRLACQCGHDQRGRVKISHIVLKNDCRTIPALL